MDFGDILNKWEKQSAARHEAYDKDAEQPPEENAAGKDRGERRSRLLHKRPDASIDLHGLTRDEAWTSLETFFENSRRDGFEKLLVIHGKGNHRNTVSSNNGSSNNGSQDEGVLKDLTRHFIENCSFAGESGPSTSREGGAGATWVILKETNVPGK